MGLLIDHDLFRQILYLMDRTVYFRIDGGYINRCQHDFKHFRFIARRLGITNEIIERFIKAIAREGRIYCDCELLLNYEDEIAEAL